MDSILQLPKTLLLENLRSVSTQSYSCESEYDQWKNWLDNHPILPIPNASHDSSITQFIQQSPIRDLDSTQYLRIQYNPTADSTLNHAQLSLLSCFLDLITSSNDAMSIAYLLQDYFLCTLSKVNEECINVHNSCGDYFRLLLLFYNPPLSFKLDTLYPSWEQQVLTLLINPTSLLSSQQIVCFMQNFQQNDCHSIIWFFLAIIHSMSFAYSRDCEIAESSFEDFLHRALSTFSAIPFSTLFTMARSLPAINQESITYAIKAVASQSFFALPLSFRDIVGPVITTESRFKQFIQRSFSISSRSFILLDLRKQVHIKNELFNAESGLEETSLYSSISPTQRSNLRYFHIPYSSNHSEENLYYQQCKDSSSPVILMADSLMEANLVALLLQKSIRQFVYIAVINPNEPHDFTKLLDILLSTDDSSLKLASPYPKGFFTGWKWWRGWKKESDNETSSSEFYRSSSMEEEKRVLIQPEKQEKQERREHTREYFHEIHHCLDKIVLELDDKGENEVVSASLLSIIKPLIYTQLVTCFKKEECMKTVSEIEAIHRTEIASISVSEAEQPKHSSLCGAYLLVLTNTHLLLLKPHDDLPKESIDCVEKQENERIAAMIETLQESGLCEIEERNSQDEQLYCIQKNIPISDIRRVNILVKEEAVASVETKQLPSIHIHLSSQDDLYIHVEYAIFIVNEIMKRMNDVNITN